MSREAGGLFFWFNRTDVGPIVKPIIREAGGLGLMAAERQCILWIAGFPDFNPARSSTEIGVKRYQCDRARIGFPRAPLRYGRCSGDETQGTMVTNGRDDPLPKTAGGKSCSWPPGRRSLYPR